MLPSHTRTILILLAAAGALALVNPVSTFASSLLLLVAAVGAACGFRWALAAAALSTLFVADLLHPPLFNLRLPAPEDRYRLAEFAAGGALLAGLCGLIDRQRRRATASGEAEREEERAKYAAAEERLCRQNAALEQQVAERTAELETQRRLLDAILDALPVAVVLAAPDGRPLRTNPALRQMCGDAPAGDERHREWVGYWPDAGRRVEPPEWPLNRAVFDGETCQPQVLEVERLGDRARRRLLIGAAPVRGADGAILAGVMTGVDVTDRDRAEGARRASEERFRVLFEESSDAHLIFDAATGGIIDCNRAAVRMLRCVDKDHLLGLHPAVFSPELQPDGRRSLEKCVEMDATARRVGYHRFDWLHRRLDGEVFPCEVTLTPVELNGRPALLTVWHDLTERYRAEAQVRESEERFRAFMDNSPGVAFLKAEDGRYVFLNRRFEEVHRVRTADWLGKTDHDVWPAALADELRRNDLTALNADRVLETTERVPVAGGEERVWRVAKFLVRDAAGRRYVGGTAIDVTEERRAEDRLRASLREKEVLLKEIHHRVKNNLQIVSALLDLQSGYAADPAVVAMFRESQDRVRSMSLIHERLYRSADLAGVDFAEYTRQLAGDLFRAYLVDADVSLDLVVDVPPLPIDVAIPCGLLLNELISNSLKHGFRDRPAGTVHVELIRGQAQTALTVADDGCGPPPDLNFRQAKSFGLQLVYTLAEQLEGAVEFVTGSGTAVTVRFPNLKAHHA